MFAFDNARYVLHPLYSVLKYFGVNHFTVVVRQSLIYLQRSSTGYVTQVIPNPNEGIAV